MGTGTTPGYPEESVILNLGNKGERKWDESLRSTMAEDGREWP